MFMKSKESKETVMWGNSKVGKQMVETSFLKSSETEKWGNRPFP